jgi:hypothetical protein
VQQLLAAKQALKLDGFLKKLDRYSVVVVTDFFTIVLCPELWS